LPARLSAALNLTSDQRGEMAERNRALARSRADWRLHAGALQHTYQNAVDSYVPRILTNPVSAWIADRHLAYHRRQFAEPYRSTVHLGRFVQRILGARLETACTALDAGCGAGANIFHLSRILTETRWTGVDITASLFDVHGALTAEHGGYANPWNLIAGDLLPSPQAPSTPLFRPCVSIQTVSWLDGYAGFVPQFLAIAQARRRRFRHQSVHRVHVDAQNRDYRIRGKRLADERHVLQHLRLESLS
jgi:SAM-dependent methyltransferase